MKMDAAEPFNIPVNPVALGIPVSVVSLWICIASLWACHVGFKYILYDILDFFFCLNAESLYTV